MPKRSYDLSFGSDINKKEKKEKNIKVVKMNQIKW